jgi:phosphate transport system substrate-binding protein
MHKLWVSFAVVLWLATGCRSEKAGQAPSKLTLSGASTVAPLMSEVARRFETQNPGVRVDVQMGGSARGVMDARQGLVDIGMVSRDLKPDESDLDAHLVARDGICIIVHKTNPIASLTDEQIVSIYTGKITHWKDVGGADAPIVVVNKAEGRSTLELFLHHFQLKNSDIKAQVVIGDNQQGIKTVQGSPEAIGYVSIGAAEYAARQGESLRLLPMAGVEASTDSVRNGTFPLGRTLNLVTKKGQQNELARKFITFAQSSEINDLIEKQYFIPMGK